MERLKFMAMMAMATMGALLALPALASPVTSNHQFGYIPIGLHDATGAKDPWPGIELGYIPTVDYIPIYAPLINKAPIEHTIITPVDTSIITAGHIRPEGGDDKITGQTLGLQARGSDKELLKRPKKDVGPQAGVSGGIISSHGDNGSSIIGRGGGILYAT